MGIKIPPYTQLTNNQKRLIEITTKQGNHLILGGPGTGKSVLALYLSQIINDDSINLITYNKNLSIYLNEGINSIPKNELKNIKAKTFDGYFGGFIYTNNPELSEQLNLNKNYHKIKFDEAANFTDKKELSNIEKTFIVDEAQDLATTFHQFIHHISPTVKIFADQNQIITNKKVGTSTIEEIIKIYHLKEIKGDCSMLTENFRNTKQIIEFSRFFETYNQAMETPIRIGPKPRLEKLQTREEMIDRIVNIIDNNADKTIGIFIPYFNDKGIWVIKDEIQNAYAIKCNNTDRITSSFGGKAKLALMIIMLIS